MAGEGKTMYWGVWHQQEQAFTQVPGQHGDTARGKVEKGEGPDDRVMGIVMSE